MTKSTDTAPAAPAATLVATDLDKILARFDDSNASHTINLIECNALDDRSNPDLIADQIEASIVTLPKGRTMLDSKGIADRLRTKPKRRKGTHVAHTLDALVDLGNRFKHDNSVIFADRDAAHIEIILDFHPASADNTDACFGGHRIAYDLPHSREWKTWLNSNDVPMKQADFAAFIEDHLIDIVPPSPQLLGAITEAATGGDFGDRTLTEEMAYLARELGSRFALPSDMVTLSKGLELREDLVIKNRVKLDSGEAQITFESSHTDGSGAPLMVPNLFLIGIPVYDAGERFYIACRLRYRTAGGSLTWFYELFRHERVLEYAFKTTAQKASADTNLPLYRGRDQ